MRKRSFRWLMFALVVCVVAAGAVQYARRTVEGRLEARLPQIIGPAQHYRVRLGGVNIATGAARRVTILGERVAMPNAPVVDRLEVRLEDVQVDFQREELRSVAHANARADLLPEDVAIYLNGRQGIEDASVAFAAPNLVTLQFRPEFGGTGLWRGARVEAAGRLVGQGPRVRFEVDQLNVQGVSAGGAAMAPLSRAINPVVDLSRMPGGITITDIRAEPGGLTVRAAGAYPPIPAR